MFFKCNLPFLPVERSTTLSEPSVDVRQRPRVQFSVVNVTSPLGSVLSGRNGVVGEFPTEPLHVARLVQEQLLETLKLLEVGLHPECCTVRETGRLGQGKVQPVVNLWRSARSCSSRSRSRGCGRWKDNVLRFLVVNNGPKHLLAQWTFRFDLKIRQEFFLFHQIQIIIVSTLLPCSTRADNGSKTGGDRNLCSTFDGTCPDRWHIWAEVSCGHSPSCLRPPLPCNCPLPPPTRNCPACPAANLTAECLKAKFPKNQASEDNR